MTKRQRADELKSYVVTRQDIEQRIEDVVRMCNEVDGPKVFLDPVRGYGLFADQDYPVGKKVTTYGGEVYHDEVSGDYVAFTGSVYIDGYCGFQVKEKARWINESDSSRTEVNVKLGRDVIVVKAVKKGEQFFADYGVDYVREYYSPLQLVPSFFSMQTIIRNV